MSLIQESKEELKRADHLLYVSLKYTRTVDVIKSLIERLISGIDFAIEALLQDAKEKKLIKEVPDNTGLKYELARKLRKDDEKINDMVIFCTMLRKINKAEYKKSNEYRRHVTLTAITDSGIVNVNLDIIKEYYERAADYVDHVDQILNPRTE